jgi:hypothetical protein
MARIVIKTVDQAAVVDFPAIAGVTGVGRIKTRPVIADADRPVLLWHHQLEAGARLSLDRPVMDHAFYVLEGAVSADGSSVAQGSVVAAEHLCRAEIATADGARLLHFHRPDAHLQKPQRAGGHVHVIGSNGKLQADIPKYGHGIVWADGACPTCEMWLNQTTAVGAHAQKGTHYHTADEIIYLLDGAMLMGGRSLGAGTAVAVDAHTRYGVGTGEAGMSLLNFRPQDSLLVSIDGTKENPAVEREMWQALAAT